MVRTLLASGGLGPVTFCLNLEGTSPKQGKPNRVRPQQVKRGCLLHLLRQYIHSRPHHSVADQLCNVAGVKARLCGAG